MKRDRIEESLDVLNGLQVQMVRDGATRALVYAIRREQFYMDAETRAFLSDGGPEFLVEQQGATR